MKKLNFVILLTSCFIFLAGICTLKCNAQSNLNIAFSQERGFYDSPFTLNINVNGYNPTTWYTTDGSDPKTSPSKVVLTPLTAITVDKTTVVRVLAVGGLDSLRTAHTFIFPNQVIQQENNNTINQLDYPPVWGTGVTNIVDPNSPSNSTQYLTITQNADYEMDPAVVGDPAYQNQLIDGLKQIPTLSISTDKANLFDDNTGIYDNTLQSGPNWEVPASIELFNGDGTSIFQEEAGLRMSGASTRKYDFYKHSFRLVFKSKYGDTKLRHNIFGAEAANQYNTLQLRMVGHCSPHDWEHRRRLKTQLHKDHWTRQIYRQMGNLSPNSKFVHLYLNGLYWGMYDVTERPDADYLSTYLGGDELDYDAVKILEIKDGDSLAYYKMFDIANSAIPDTIYTNWGYNTIPNEVNINAMYDEIVNYLDVEAFIDYFLINALFVNTDWGANNWWAGRKREPGAGWKYFVWDAEFVLNDAPIYTSRIFQGSDNYHPNELDKKLRPVKRYKKAFGDRIQCHCFEEDGALHVNNLLATYENIAQSIDKATLLELARWGDVRGELIDYNSNVAPETAIYLQEIIPDLLEGSQGLLKYLRHEDVQYYPLGVFAPKLSSLGGEVPQGYQLYLTNPNSIGEIYYTLDGSDPAENPASIKYTNPITINDYSRVSARVFVETYVYGFGNKDTIHNHWSAMCPRDFFVNGYYDNIAINEIHYNPVDVGNTSGGLFEFIELKNNGASKVNLCNTFFNKGINYNFPDNTFINPNDFVILVRDQSTFGNNHSVVVDGEFDGKLSNGGEKLTLNRPDGVLIDEVIYDDYTPWDTIPDGSGESLSLDFVSLPQTDNDYYSSWRSSVGGPTPRKENVFCAPVSLTIYDANPSCIGANDGYISITANGAGGPFTYQWSNGSTDSYLTNISSGSYQVLINDTQNCPTTKTVVLNNADPLIDNLSVQPASSANSNDGSATLTLNDSSASYDISWSNGVTNSTMASNLNTGNYTVTVDNGQGCTQTQPFEITVGAPCPIPTNVVASATGNNSLLLSWDNNGTTISTKIDWRLEGSSAWDSDTTTNNSCPISNLQACKTYEYRINGVCASNSVSSATSIATVSTSCSQNGCNSSNTNGFSHNVTNTSAFIVWDINPNSTYELFYRKTNSNSWFSYELNYNFAILFNLDSCSDYEWYVEITCPNNSVSTSNPNAFQTTCNKLSDENHIENLPVGKKESILYYPNPAKDILTVLVPDYIGIEDAYVDIYDLNGRLVKSTKLIDRNYKLNISNLQKGMYLLNFSNKLITESGKIQVY